jgi:TIGR02453 family protein
MQKVLSFLQQIRDNNNKDWFDAHKSEYLEANAIFQNFVTKLIAGIAEFDESVRGLTPKDCMYRFHRDTRFSANKMPYKTHFGAFICPNGKNSGYSGYYFHIEPAGNGYLGGHQLDTGVYCPEPNVLKSIREEIYFNGEAFDSTIQQAKDFSLEDSQALKKVPRGFPADFKYAEYLKMKNPCLCKHLDNDFILSENLFENTVEAFRLTYEFNSFLNKAIAYAKE